MMLVLSTKRLMRTWRVPCMLTLLLLLLWVISSSIKNRSKILPAGESHNSHPEITDPKNINFHQDREEDLLAQNEREEIVQPNFLRRNSSPGMREALDKNIIDEENVAKEQVDGVKDDEEGFIVNKDDGNNAKEEHSAEFVLPSENKKQAFSLKASLSKERLKLKKELEEQEESFHQLPEFPLEKPVALEEQSKNIQEINFIASINSKAQNLLHGLNKHSKHLDDIHEQPKAKNNGLNLYKDKTEKERVQAQEESFHQLPEHQKELPEDKYGSYHNWRNFTVDDINKLSTLGRRLYLNEKSGPEQNKQFIIHVWKHKKHIARRFLKETSIEKFNPFEDCSVHNCQLTYNDEQVLQADAVLFHLHRLSGPPSDVPRKTNQLWVWLSDESPYNVFMVSRDKDLSHYSGYFNWSMTYRSDADVPVPYGRTVPLPKEQYLTNVEDISSTKNKNITIMGSNCGGSNHRYKYINELQKYIHVDIYGNCGSLKCPGHFNNDCPLINDYKFYLSFENSNCDEYITEKVGLHSPSFTNVHVHILFTVVR